ncbi:tektin 2 (testicular) [Chamberlinius hualienensis]
MKKVRKDAIMPEDWMSRNRELQEHSKMLENVSKQNRFEIDEQKLEIASNARWTEYRTKNALFVRIAEVRKLKIDLQLHLTATKNEQKLLSKTLDNCENLGDDLLPLEKAIVQCLQIREEKKSGEILNDSVHKHLIEAQQLIKQLLNCLQNSSLECRKQSEILHKCVYNLESAIQRQDESLKIDQDQLALQSSSAGVSLKPQTTTLPQTMAKNIWEDFLNEILKMTNENLDKSRGLRGEVAANINVVQQELLRQKDAVEFALRQAIHLEEQTVEQLQWQKNYLEDEITKGETSLKDLEKYRSESVKPLKVTQSRLVNRDERPPLELCFDNAQHCLKQQLEFWHETHDVLDGQLRHYRELVLKLEEQRDFVIKELKTKQNTLKLDKRCLEISKHFKLFPSTSKVSDLVTKELSNMSFSTPEKFWQKALPEK